MDAIAWPAMTRKIFLSLALGPIFSLVLLWFLAPVFQRAADILGKYTLSLRPGSFFIASGFSPIQILGSLKIKRGNPKGADPLNALHWLSSGLASFARGLNDTPKILALGLTASAMLGITNISAFLLVALAMGAGGLWGGIRVTRTLSEKVTKFSPLQGFGANAVTALLVGAASSFGLPVSTTHISSGAILATGLRRDAKSVQWRTVGEMALAWVVTLPTAAIISAAVYGILR